MTETPSPALDTIREQFKKGTYDQAQEGLNVYLAAHPQDTTALALQRHLDNLDTLKQINRLVARQDWDQAVQEIEQALALGLTWDIELRPLTELSQSAAQRRTEAARHRAQALIRQAEAAAKAQDVAQARELYNQAAAIPHGDPDLGDQIQQRIQALRRDSHETLSTVASFMQPDALMEQLVGTILKRSKPQLAESVRLCAISYWFDLELLSALRDSDDGLDEKILARMARFSFVQSDDRDRYTFSEDVRRYLLNEWEKDRAGFVEAHRRAQSYFLQKLQSVLPDDDVVQTLTRPGKATLSRTLAQVSPQVGELLQNYLYHSLAVDGDSGIVLLRQLFHAADEAHRPALAERYLAVANDQRAWLNPDQRAHLDYMRGLLDQLHGRWEASRALFERMLSREGLPITLQARIRRALGNTLIQQEQWVEAIAQFENALQVFQADEDDLESALTMIGLGRAHLDLALNTWGGGEAFSLRESWLDRIQNLAQFASRLPIIAYLMSQLSVRALLPVILRVGQDIDWVVARLFVTAATWFNRADALLRRLNDQEGLGRVEENLAWLYLLLGHYSQAEEIYRRLLTRQGKTFGEYRAARAQLGLAETLVRQGRLREAHELLDHVLSIFAAYQHQERLAQAHILLGQTYALETEPASAVTHYQQAVQLYQQLGDDAGATEALEQMRLLQDEPATDAATRETIVDSARQITRRRYLTRFSLSLLYLFRLLALGGLAGVILFGLFTSIRVETGTDFDVGQALLNSQHNVASPFEPAIEFELQPQLQSSSSVDFAISLVLAAIALYLILYTALGLWLTMRTPLRTLQDEQRFDITVDAEGISRGTEDLPGSLKLPWSQVTAMLSSDRRLFRKPIPLFSRFALFGERGAVTIDGQTRRYPAARDFIETQLNEPEQQRGRGILTYDFGFSVLHSRSGWLFISTLLFILAFVVTAQINPQGLATRLAPLPYSLSDIYGISYLGLLFPVGWWLVVQPLRERLFLKPETRRVWLIGLVGLLLAAFTLIDLGWLRLPIGRPNVAPGLFAAFMLGLALYYLWKTRHWEHRPFQKGEPVYSLPVRLASTILALGVIVPVLGAVGREIGAYHYLAMANLYRQRATQPSSVDQEARVQTNYQKALSYYDRALNWVGNDAHTYHTRGTMLTQMGRYQEATPSLQEAVRRAPDNLDYRRSLAMTYDLWANARREADDIEDIQKLYDLARTQYSQIIERSGQDGYDLKTLYLLRAGASFQIAKYQEEELKNIDIAARNYQAARKDYERVTKLVPDHPSALTGLGWAQYKLARLSDDPAKTREGLTSALERFEQASVSDPQQVSAWTGQGYAHFSIGRTYAWWDEAQGRTRSACADSSRNPNTLDEKLIYTEENLEALDAFSQATTLAPNDVSLHNLLGRVRFVLINCPGIKDEQLYLDAIQDYTRAIELEPNNPDWYEIRANFYYSLGPEYYDRSIADYESALSLDPNADGYWTLGNLYWAQGEQERALEAYADAVELAPDSYGKQVQLGWNAYLAGDYPLSAQASQAAARLDPTDPRPFFNEGLAWVAKGEAQKAQEAYEEGIAVAEALVDPEKRISRYDEALTDLSGVPQDPSNVAAALRARLTFNKGLAYVRQDEADAAQSVYEQGIEIAATVRGRETRQALYDEAIQDLRALTADATLVAELIELLQDSRER